jgi:hypothetical protein
LFFGSGLDNSDEMNYDSKISCVFTTTDFSIENFTNNNFEQFVIPQIPSFILEFDANNMDINE